VNSGNLIWSLMSYLSYLIETKVCSIPRRPAVSLFLPAWRDRHSITYNKGRLHLVRINDFIFAINQGCHWVSDFSSQIIAYDRLNGKEQKYITMALIGHEQQLHMHRDKKEFEDKRDNSGTFMNGSAKSAVLYSSLNHPPPTAISSKGCWITTAEGLDIIDASSGAAVACLGHNDSRVNAAILAQLEKIAYTYAPFLTSEPVERLALELSRSTNHRLPKAFIVSSGTLIASLYYPGGLNID
jgi:hypothetical protein